MDQNPNNNPKAPGTGDEKKKGSLFFALLITVVIVLVITTVYNAISNSQYTLVKFSDFETAKVSGQLAQVQLHADRIIYMTKEEAAKPASQQKAFYTGLPLGDAMTLAETLHEMGVTVDQVVVEDNSTIITITW